MSNSPSMHEDVAKIAPGLSSELRVVWQWALQEVWRWHLQNPAVQLQSVIHKDNNLRKMW